MILMGKGNNILTTKQTFQFTLAECFKLQFKIMSF